MQLCQLEFYSRDPRASLDFVKAVLGWREVPISIQDQFILHVDEQSPYGISIRKASSTGSPSVMAYFRVESELTELRDQCLTLGAHIIEEPKTVVGYGKLMIVEESGGLRLGFFKAH